MQKLQLLLGKKLTIIQKYIEKINQSNELRNSDKTLAAQVVITQAQLHASRMSPLDPRERGAELGEYGDQGWVDTHGHEALNRRTDMDD